MLDDISSIKVFPLTGFNNLKAMVSLNYRGVILRAMRLMEEDDGTLRLGMPSRKLGERWEDIYFFPDTDMRNRICDAVVAIYREEIKK
jgi:DNA-binding cell septation regulator SpoVG